MVKLLYEDDHLLVIEKPVGMDSQSSRDFEPDVVSELKNYFNNIYTCGKPPYIGVIHRLDKPVGGVMVYAKSPFAAAELSKQIQEGLMQKFYYAVVCGKPVDIVGNYVDWLLKDGKNNCSHIVDKGITGAKRAELNYKVLKTNEIDRDILSLVEIELLTGRHHQIRVQFAGHGYPLWGDNKYNQEFRDGIKKGFVGLCAYKLRFAHPKSKENIEFQIKPFGGIFQNFIKDFNCEV